jgi:hypothetical protein
VTPLLVQTAQIEKLQGVRCAGVPAGLAGYACDVLYVTDILAHHPTIELIESTDVGWSNIPDWHALLSSIRGLRKVTMVMEDCFNKRFVRVWLKIKPWRTAKLWRLYSGRRTVKEKNLWQLKVRN